jgi:adenylate cyclase
MSQTRRLAAILAADVAGYSRLMGTDEEGTHERLKAHLRELVDPKIAEHRGRIVKNTGDGFLVEFPSVVDTIRCAVEIQRGMAEREPEVPEKRRIRFRIGINLGDVIVEPHDIFGDGVNVAARLEALAEPGGICVSRVVRDQVRDRLDCTFEDLGEQQLKNIARPVRVYAARPEHTRALAVSTAIPRPADEPRLSIVVLPFLNLSQDASVDYLVDGIVDSLITDLSCALPGSFVISRSTAFTYKGRQVGIRQVGQELGVRYVLEGSVWADPRRVRVNVQLIDARTDENLWAERFDKKRTDIPEVQDEIVARLSRSVGIEMVRTEAARSNPGNSGDAVDLVMRARACLTLLTSKQRILGSAQASCSDEPSKSIPTMSMHWWASLPSTFTR